ncbi:MAG: hypothetical protein AAGU11_19205 [Syntrophobacteraceae bacterium]
MYMCNKAASKALFFACCLLASAVLASCGSMNKGEKKKENLLMTVEAFNSAFKWEDYNAAGMFIAPGKKEQFWKEVDLFKGKIRITDVQIRDVDYIDNSPSGTVILWVQYFRTSLPTLQTVTFRQRWYFLEEEKHWQLVESGFQAISK